MKQLRFILFSLLFILFSEISCSSVCFVPLFFTHHSFWLYYQFIIVTFSPYNSFKFFVCNLLTAYNSFIVNKGSKSSDNYKQNFYYAFITFLFFFLTVSKRKKTTFRILRQNVVDGATAIFKFRAKMSFPLVSAILRNESISVDCLE